MIDYEEVVEAIWRYDIPRIDIDEDVTTLYADGKAFAQVIRRPDGSREDLYFEDTPCMLLRISLALIPIHTTISSISTRIFCRTWR